MGGQKKAAEANIIEDHAELDMIDSLGLADTSSNIRLKELLLQETIDGEETLPQLVEVVRARIDEGHGETLFDLGLEDNGESMAFSKEQWDVALDRIRRAATAIESDCRILMTRNVGGPVGADTVNEKEKGASGKIMIRQKPETVDDVIETRIAVVGNGTLRMTLVV